MRPTEILSAEHRVIEQVLDCLEKMAAAARTTRGLDQQRAAQALEVLRTFADRCHHGKEEERLFPMLEQRGMPTHVGPIAVMLDDHKAARSLIQRMGAALEEARAGSAQAPGLFADAASQYVDLLRDHIAKEDGVLFPMAESMLDDDARALLLRRFGEVEELDLGPDTHERMIALADGLAHHYGVPLASARGAPSLAGHCCHHH